VPHCDIFISYDRNSAAAPALVLYRHLCRYFHQERIYIDHEDIRSENLHPEQLDEYIRQSKVVLFLITGDWISTITVDNAHDIHTPQPDRLLHEIALTLNSGRTFIPILYDGASIPFGTHLPTALRELAMYSGFALSGKDNESQIVELARLIAKVPGIAEPRLDIDNSIRPAPSSDDEDLPEQAAEPTAEATTRTATSTLAYDSFQEGHISEPSAPGFVSSDDLDKVTSIHNEAESLWLEGDLTKARILEEKALGIRYQVLGKEHPDTLTALCNLAEMFWAQGDLAKAKALHKQVLDIRRHTLGDRHSDTTASAWNLFLILTQAFDHGAAGDVIQQYLSWLQDSDPKELSPEQRRIRDMILQFFA